MIQIVALSADIAAYVKRHWIRADPWEDPAAFLERSPIMYVGDVETPTMLMVGEEDYSCLLYTSPSPRDGLLSRMPSSA